MVFEPIFCYFGGPSKLLLPLCSVERALECEGEPASVQLANSFSIICEGFTKELQNCMQNRAQLVLFVRS
jgi:hypothetical protein